MVCSWIVWSCLAQCDDRTIRIYGKCISSSASSHGREEDSGIVGCFVVSTCCVVTDVSRDRSVFIFRIRPSKKTRLGDTPQKSWIFSSTAVKTAHLIWQRCLNACVRKSTVLRTRQHTRWFSFFFLSSILFRLFVNSCRVARIKILSFVRDAFHIQAPYYNYDWRSVYAVTCCSKHRVFGT